MTCMYFFRPKRLLKLTAFSRVQHFETYNEVDVHMLHSTLLQLSATSFGDKNAPTGPVAFQEFDNM
jgi:hypothetical protein